MTSNKLGGRFMASIDDGRGAEGEYDGEGCREKRQQKLFGAGRRFFFHIHFILFGMSCIVSIPHGGQPHAHP